MYMGFVHCGGAFKMTMHYGTKTVNPFQNRENFEKPIQGSKFALILRRNRGAPHSW